MVKMVKIDCITIVFFKRNMFFTVNLMVICLLQW